MELGFAEHVWQDKRGAMAQEAVDDRALQRCRVQPAVPISESTSHANPSLCTCACFRWPFATGLSGQALVESPMVRAHVPRTVCDGTAPWYSRTCVRAHVRLYGTSTCAIPRSLVRRCAGGHGLRAIGARWVCWRCTPAHLVCTRLPCAPAPPRTQ